MGSVALSNHAYGLSANSTSQSSDCKVIKSAWMAGRAPKIPGARFSRKKNVGFSEIHWTSDTSLVSLALWKEAYGLYGTFTSQSIVCKVK